MATLSVRTQAVNKKGLAPVYVYYFHNSLRYPISLGYSIDPNHLDKVKNRITHKEAHFREINEKILEIETRINKIIKSTPAHIEPTHTYMKEKYEALLREESDAVKNQQLAQTGKKGLKAVTAFEADEIEEQQAELNAKRKEVQASPYYVADEGRVIAEMLKEFDALLWEKERELSKETLKAWYTFRKRFFIEFPQSQTYKQAKEKMGVTLCPEGMNNTFNKVLNEWFAKEKSIFDKTAGKYYKILKQYLSFLEVRRSDLKVCREYTKFKLPDDVIEDFVVIEPEEIDLY